MNATYQLAGLAALGVVAFALLDSESGIPNFVKRTVTSSEHAMMEFACLNERDGTLKALNYVAKNRVRYPEAYEHLNTQVTPSAEKGASDVTMKYRVRDAAGNLTIKFASATVRHSDCVATKTDIPR